MKKLSRCIKDILNIAFVTIIIVLFMITFVSLSILFIIGGVLTAVKNCLYSYITKYLNRKVDGIL